MIVCVAVAAPSPSTAEPVPVAHLEGLAHGFLALRSLDGTLLADGDLIQNSVQTSSGNRVTVRLVFRFKDGSTRDEVSVYLQRKHFRLLSNHVVQKGPAFKKPMESNIDAETGRVTVRYTDDDGKQKAIDEHVDLPDDLANGMFMVLLKNISPRTAKTTVSMLALTPEPRLVKLDFVPEGEQQFLIAGHVNKATRFAMKVSVPGLTGVVASIFGKLPPDSHFWILGGDAPAFVKAEAQLFADGPIWRIELASPVFPSSPSAAARGAKRAPRRKQ